MKTFTRLVSTLFALFAMTAYMVGQETTTETRTLTFDASTGILYAGSEAYTENTDTWDVNGNMLTLHNFNWITMADTALKIVGGDAIITLGSNSENAIKSLSTSDNNSFGIFSENNLQIIGEYSLEIYGAKQAISVQSLFCYNFIFWYSNNYDKNDMSKSYGYTSEYKHTILTCFNNKTLFFNSTNGKFFLDNGDGVYNSNDDTEYKHQKDSYEWSGNTLTLKGFNWVTSAPTALRVLGDDFTLYLADAINNHFESSYLLDDINTYGIYIENDILIDGDGKLSLYTYTGDSCHIFYASKSVTINNGNISLATTGGKKSYGAKIIDSLIMNNGYLSIFCNGSEFGYALYAGNGFTLYDGTCSFYTYGAANTYGIYTESTNDVGINIKNGIINIDCYSYLNPNFSAGMYSTKDIVIHGGRIYSNGGDYICDNGSYGLFTNKNIKIYDSYFKSIGHTSALNKAPVLSYINDYRYWTYDIPSEPIDIDYDYEIDYDSGTDGTITPYSYDSDHRYILITTSSDYILDEIVRILDYIHQDNAATEDALKDYLVNTINNLTVMKENNFIITHDDILITNFNAATAATLQNPYGIWGFFNCNIKINGSYILTNRADYYWNILTSKYSTPSEPLAQPYIEGKYLGNLTFLISNTGKAESSDIHLRLSGNDKNAFTIKETPIEALTPGESIEITIDTIPNLEDRTYEAILTARGTNFADARIAFTYDVDSAVGNDNISTPTFKAYISNGTLHLSGLPTGKHWQIYSIKGQLIHSAIADGDDIKYTLPERGVYVIASESEVVKVVY